MYPEFVEISGKQYKINTDYKVALACFRAIEDEDINDTARAIVVMSLLFGEEDKDGNINIPEFDNYDEVGLIIKKYLCCGREMENTQTIKKDMDYDYDKDLICASFMSDYKIDLSKEDMHWWHFFSLLNGLTEKCILNQVREIRNYDLEEIKDSKSRRKMEEAKERVALPVNYTREEQDIIDKFNSLFE